MKYYTPHFVTDIVAPYLRGTLWEPAVGQGHMQERLRMHGFDVIGSDIETGNDYFHYAPDRRWDMQVTNPPYRWKYQWLKRALQFGKPFALLLPLQVGFMPVAQKMQKRYGSFEYLIPNQKIRYIDPVGRLAAMCTFTAWLTWGLEINETISYVDVCDRSKESSRALTANLASQHQSESSGDVSSARLRQRRKSGLGKELASPLRKGGGAVLAYGSR